MTQFQNLRDEFLNPPSQYRSTPFWAWNDQLDEQELVRQVKDMKDQGFGGFFIHSREGLETEYMGEKWLHCVKEVVKAAKELGLEAWLYDEDRWPSGTAGGRVPAKGDAFRAKGLTLELTTAPVQNDPSIIALYRARINSGDPMRLDECGQVNPGGDLTPLLGETLLVFRVEISRKSEWFNGETPPDNLNPDTVAAFIQCTHEVYRRAVGEDFGSAVPGFFSDEPGIHDRNCAFTPGRGWVPWTARFPQEFLKRRGWNLFSQLPFLFFNGADSAHIRHDYWRTVTELFRESFPGQIGRWCREHGLRLTGHFLWENKLGVATRVCGAVMPNYTCEQDPGIDLLCEQIDECITVKQCTSVASQYGKKTVVSETYGCTGWEFDFEGQKWIGDWMYVLGVNRRCQHLMLYSLRGCRKRDYPPSFNYHSPQWKYTRFTEDYFARIAAVMTKGEAIRDILVIHPSSTAWSELGSNPYGFERRGDDRDIPAINRYGDRFNRFLQNLLGAHYDFDLGDETILSETGNVDGTAFVVNRCRYRAVILPRLKSLFKTTVDLLLRFLDAGGFVLTVGPLPTMVEGQPSKMPEKLLTHPRLYRLQDETQMIPALEHVLPRRIDIRDEFSSPVASILYQLRDLGTKRALFVVNTDRERAYHAEIRLDFTGAAEEWDPLTAAVSTVQAVQIPGGSVINARFGPAGSKLYLIDCRATPAGNGPLKKKHAATSELLAALGPSCRFSRTAPNVLTLDMCRYRISEGEWSQEQEVWKAQREVRKRLQMRPIHRNGIPQRYKWIHEAVPMDGTRVSFLFAFDVKELPDGVVRLAMESPNDFELALNGERVDSKPDGWFLDRSFQTIPLPGVKGGENTLTLSCSYRSRMEVEAMYLTGDFGVDADRRMIREPKMLHFGDWCFQGYFHYCGGMVYHFETSLRTQPGDRVVLRPGAYSAVMAEVTVNETTAGIIPWRSVEELELTGLVKNGLNRIDIEITGSARNMMGPFHQARGKLPNTDCASFTCEGSEFTPGYTVHPYGLFGQIGIYRLIQP